MTREERAVACITEHRGAEYVNPKMVRAMLAFADAEAAAMRERAAMVVEAADGIALPAYWRGRKDAAAAIRALPATGEVGRG